MDFVSLSFPKTTPQRNTGYLSPWPGGGGHGQPVPPPPPVRRSPRAEWATATPINGGHWRWIAPPTESQDGTNDLYKSTLPTGGARRAGNRRLRDRQSDWWKKSKEMGQTDGGKEGEGNRRLGDEATDGCNQRSWKGRRKDFHGQWET